MIDRKAIEARWRLGEFPNLTIRTSVGTYYSARLAHVFYGPGVSLCTSIIDWDGSQGWEPGAPICDQCVHKMVERFALFDSIVR